MRKRCWKKINKEWLPEIIIFGSLTVVLISFLLVYFWRTIVFSNLQNLWLFFVNNVTPWLLDPIKLITIILLITVLCFLLIRLRYHILRLANDNQVCPICGHELHRRHRQIYQRLFSSYIPIRPYKCHRCGWKGLRIDKKSTFVKRIINSK